MKSKPDSLVSLQILGNVSEFQRVVNVLQEGVDFDIDVNASVFETNIRGEVGLSVGFVWGFLLVRVSEVVVRRWSEGTGDEE